MTQNHVIVFILFILIVFSGGELPVDNKCRFSSFPRVWKHPWPRVNRCHLLFSFPFIAVHFAFISSHVPFILHSFPFILRSCPFMFRRCVSKIQVFESWYAQSGQAYIRPNARVFSTFRYRFCYRLAIVLEACAGCHLQASWTCTCISSLLFFYSYCFLGRHCKPNNRWVRGWLVPGSFWKLAEGTIRCPKWVRYGNLLTTHTFNSDPYPAMSNDHVTKQGF